MRICIICRELREKFSLEHVIPDALGGRYHIFTVCQACNSDLGSLVDSKLVNHKFVEFQRYILGLTGKGGHLPNPFSGTHSFEGDEVRRVQLRLNDDGKPTPYVLPKVEYVNDNMGDGTTSISICLDALDESKLEGILEKLSVRLELPRESLRVEARTVETVERPSIKASLEIDLTEFKIGLLKIAYEFAVDTIPQYFHDTDAVVISRILKEAEYSLVENYVKIGSGFDHGIFDALSNFLDLKSKKHYLILASSADSGLTCLIHLCGMFSVGVNLSAVHYSETPIVIGVNDLEGKSFRKIVAADLIDLVYGPSSQSFQYYFPDETAMRKFLYEQAQDGFCFLTHNAGIAVFDKSGSPLAKSFEDTLREAESLAVTEECGDGVIVTILPIQEEVFEKIMPSHQLVQIVAVREERPLISKL